MFPLIFQFKKLIINFFLLIQLVLLFFAISSCQKTNFTDTHTQWLKSNAVNIKTIDPDDEDFTDLQPLKKIIGDSVRIVLLGENSHSDGSAFLAKSRMIKFLHKEMGFDVLAFESGLYECSKAWQLMKEGRDARSVMTTSVFTLWSGTKECQSLIKYINNNKQSKNPLELSGFDCQLTGSISSDFMLDDLDSLKLNCLTQKEKNDLFSLMRNKYNYANVDTIVYNRIFNKLLTSLGEKKKKSAFSGKYLTHDFQFWEHVIENLKIFLYLRTGSRSSSNYAELYSNVRDRQMGRNLIWLANYVYPDRKIIVWAHNYHNMRNVSSISNIFSVINMNRYVVTMGDIIFKEFGKKIYNVCFVSHDGKLISILTGETENIPEPGMNNIEFQIYNSGFEYSFVNLQNLDEKGNWLNDSMVMRPFAFTPFYADWTKEIDGIFYIKTMIPSSY